MFRSYTNKKGQNGSKHHSSEMDIFTSHVRISYRFYQFVTTRYTTDFYIIKSILQVLIFIVNDFVLQRDQFWTCLLTIAADNPCRFLIIMIIILFLVKHQFQMISICPTEGISTIYPLNWIFQNWLP